MIGYFESNNILFHSLHNIDVNNVWFQQDGATCHTTHPTIDLLSIIDLNVWWPLDYFLWCAVKEKYYAGKPKAIEHLKTNIMFRQALLVSQYSFICEQYFKCSDT